MHKLPTELLNSIFLQLNFSQKLECMLVCRNWANIIRTDCLFHTVDIATMNAFESFISTSIDQPDIAKQVNRLIITNCYEISFDPGSLCLTFPYLNFFCLKELRNQNYEFQTFSVQEEEERLEIPRKHIKEIIDFGWCNYTRTLLNGGVCSQLTSLTLEVFDLPKDKFDQAFVVLLQNAPNLLHLTIINATSTYNLFETLSEYLPKLKALVLDVLDLKGNPVFPVTVKPWTSLKKLSINTDIMPIQTEIVLLEYFSKKCGSVIDFEFWGGEKERWIREDVNERVKSGLIPFVCFYNGQLTSLKIASIPDEEDNLNIFTKMDEFNYQLQSLNVWDVWHVSVFKMLYLSQQYRFIREIVLTGLDASETPYEYLEHFISLTKLELVYVTCDEYRAIINLDSLLNTCSNRLESVELGNIILQLNDDYDDDDANSEQQYKLESLALTHSDIPSVFSVFITKRLQNLRHLKLNNSISSPMLLRIPSIHLSSFILKDSRRHGPPEISVQTLDDNKQKVYPIHVTEINQEFYDRLIDIYGVWICNTFVPLASNESVDPYDIQLVCASVDNVIINNFLAC